MVNTALETKYHVVTRTMSQANLANSGIAIEEVLNQLSQEGWEFVSLTPEPMSNQFIYVFKQLNLTKNAPLNILPADRLGSANRP